jgi:hypothetical protein
VVYQQRRIRVLSNEHSNQEMPREDDAEMERAAITGPSGGRIMNETVLLIPERAGRSKGGGCRCMIFCSEST